MEKFPRALPLVGIAAGGIDRASLTPLFKGEQPMQVSTKELKKLLLAGIVALLAALSVHGADSKVTGKQRIKNLMETQNVQDATPEDIESARLVYVQLQKAQQLNPTLTGLSQLEKLRMLLVRHEQKVRAERAEQIRQYQEKERQRAEEERKRAEQAREKAHKEWLAYWKTRRAEDINYDKYEAIRAGMTLEDVKAIVGRSSDYEAQDDNDVTIGWRRGASRLAVKIQDGRVRSKLQDGLR